VQTKQKKTANKKEKNGGGTKKNNLNKMAKRHPKK